MMLSLLLVLAAAPSSPQTWSFKTESSPAVHISNIRGSITIDGASGNNVSFEVFQEGDEKARNMNPVEVVQEGNEIRARVCCGPCEERHHRCEDAVATRFVVKVPRGAELHVSAVDAPVKVTGVEGAQEISTVNGRVDVTGAKKDVSVSAVTADVVLAPEAGHTSVSTVSGNVKLKLPEKPDVRLSFSSVGGSFNGKSTALGSVNRTWGEGTHEVDVSTVSGSLDVGSKI